MSVNDLYYWVLKLSIKIPTSYKDNVPEVNLKAHFNNAMGIDGRITLVKNVYDAHNADVFADTGSFDTFSQRIKKLLTQLF